MSQRQKAGDFATQTQTGGSVQQTSSKTGGIGFASLLGIVFITLKLTGYIAWSWWWVLAPLWAPWALVLAILAVGMAGVGIAALASTAFRR